MHTTAQQEQETVAASPEDGIVSSPPLACEAQPLAQSLLTLMHSQEASTDQLCAVDIDTLAERNYPDPHTIVAILLLSCMEQLRALPMSNASSMPALHSSRRRGGIEAVLCLLEQPTSYPAITSKMLPCTN
jgi:hypothetical protein